MQVFIPDELLNDCDLGIFGENGEARFHQLKLTQDCSTSGGAVSTPEGVQGQQMAFKCEPGFSFAQGLSTLECDDGDWKADEFGSTVRCLATSVKTGDQEREVPEGSPPGTIVGSPLNPGDAGDTFIMEIEGGNDDGLFRLEACTGQLTIGRGGSALDRESQETHMLDISVARQSNPSLKTDFEVLIRLTDVDEPPTLLVHRPDPSLPASIEEGAKAGTYVQNLVLVAWDPEQANSFWSMVGDNEAMQYVDIQVQCFFVQVANQTVLEAAGLSSDEILAIPTMPSIASAAVLRLADNCDFNEDFEQENPWISLEVRTWDALGPDALSSSASIEVSITNVNEPPIFVVGPSLTIPISSLTRSGPQTVRGAMVQLLDPDGASTVLVQAVASAATWQQLGSDGNSMVELVGGSTE